MKSLGILFLLTVYSASFEYHLKPYTVTEGVSCFFGLYGDAKEENGGRVVNTCYVESSEGYVVIDSGPTYQYAQQAYEVMQKKKPLPVKYVINTTVEDIHVLGNEFYQERGARLIGPASYYELFNPDNSSNLSQNISKEAFTNTRLVPLDSYVKSNRDIIIGDTKIEIMRLDKDEGRHLIVNFSNKNTIFVGDYISNGQAPKIDKCHSLTEWKGVLSKIESLPWQYLISSHGTKRTRTALLDTKKYLNYLAKKEEKTLQKSLDEQKKDSQRKMLAKKEKLIIKKKVVIKKIVKKEIIKKIPSIHYTNFDKAKREAKREHKYIMIKIEANNCEPCVALNQELATNNHIKEMVNKHIKAVKINTDYDDVPMGLTYMGTPTVFLIEPEGNRVLMQLEGSLAVRELEESLDIFLDDSFKKGLASL
ncbi:MAG: thioredoxin family protein [Sulfurovaceae bacterium]|nr:thioredoxin family protein [Sulfurovaceae bacterium]